MKTKHSDLEVDISAGESKAFVEGKTTVPFKTFVQLILQRKVTSLFEKWGDDPVIVNSELLTNLASAQQDSQENKAHLVLVTLGIGVLVGIFFFSVTQFVLLMVNVQFNSKDLLFISGVLVAICILAYAMSRIQRRNYSEKILEIMEKMARLLSKK